MSGFRIADAEKVEELIGRMSRRLIAEVGRDVHLVGIRRRGVPLMERMQSNLEHQLDESISSDELALKRYADDLSVLHEEPELKDEPDLNVTDRRVVVVDDVLYSGRTMWTAVQLLHSFGASQVFTASLCSRGDNDLPVEGQFIGLQLDVCEGNVIEVHIPPYEESTEIRLFHEDDLSS